MRHRAIFLDRDGTLVEPRHYPSRPADLRLYDDVGHELATLRRHGFLLILITNQSGVARGYFSEADVDAMHRHLSVELAKSGVALDGIYYCPHHVDGVRPDLAFRCDCRKPGTGMLVQAAGDLDIDLSRSWFIGDILDDVEAGNRAGCTTVLVDLGTEGPPTASLRWPDYVSRDTVHGLRIIQAVESGSHAADATYRPPSWREMETQTRQMRSAHAHHD